jgi:hypothetical protein
MKMKIEATYVGDSSNYHRFQITTEGVVGSLYLPKDKEIDELDVTVDLITPNSDPEGWSERMELLVANATPKQEKRFKSVLRRFSQAA